MIAAALLAGVGLASAALPGPAIDRNLAPSPGEVTSPAGAPSAATAAASSSGPSASGEEGISGAPSGPIAGDSLPATVTLEEVLDLLRRLSPRSAAERARIDVAAAERIAARAWPNPSIDYSGSWLRSGANTGSARLSQFGAEQPLLLFGQRAARRRFADLGVDLAEAQERESFAERAREARDRFLELLARQERVRLLEETSADLERVARVVAGRAAAGDKSRYDALRIEVEARSLQAELAGARTDAEDASGRLAAHLGFPAWRPRASGSLGGSNIDTTDEETLWSRALATRPALVTARSRQAAAEGALVLARRERLPVPVVSGGASLGFDAENRSAVAGLSIPIPLFDRGRGAIARAEAEARQASLELEAESAEARADLGRAVSVLGQRREALEALEKNVIEKLPEMRTMAEEAYREGKGDILELLDALRSIEGVREAHLDQLEGVALAETDLLFLSGGPGID